MQSKTKRIAKPVPIAVSDKVRDIVLGIDSSRPTHYSENIAIHICELIKKGITLEEIGKIEGMPSSRTISGWIRTFPAFLSEYRSARESFADYMASKAIEIAEDSSNDLKTDSKGRTIPNWENVNRSKLRAETYKWAASKFAPHKYGDKLEINTNSEPLEQSKEDRLAKLHAIVQNEYNGDLTAFLSALNLIPVPENGVSSS